MAPPGAAETELPPGLHAGLPVLSSIQSMSSSMIVQGKFTNPCANHVLHRCPHTAPIDRLFTCCGWPPPTGGLPACRGGRVCGCSRQHGAHSAGGPRRLRRAAAFALGHPHGKSPWGVGGMACMCCWGWGCNGGSAWHL